MNDQLFTDEPSPEAGLFTNQPSPESSGDETAKYWREKGDYYEAGDEKPVEQKIAENIQTVGSGMGIPSAVQGIYGIGKAGLKLAAKGAGAALNAIPLTENFVPTVERVANNQTLKSMGGTMGQLKQMAEGREGREALDKAAEFARENGLADVFSTGIGREKNLQSLKDASGKAIGALREEAGPAPKGITEKIVSNPKIDKYLGEGSASRELGGVDKALADIKEIGGAEPTHASLADAATYINKNAAGNKLYQPVNAETDVANILSKENDAGIAQSLGSDKAKQYLDALEEQRRLHPLEHLAQRGELREAGGRGGLGVRFIQEMADQFGYRLSAKAAGALHDALIGKGLLQDAKNLDLPETLKGTASLGMIPPEIAEWVRKHESDE